MFLVLQVTRLNSAYCRNRSFVPKQVDHGTSIEAAKSEDTFAVDDFVIVSHDGDLCPGQVLDLDEGDFQVSTMGRSGRYWKWMEIKDGIWYIRSAVQRKVAPLKRQGCVRFSKLIRNPEDFFSCFFFFKLHLFFLAFCNLQYRL